MVPHMGLLSLVIVSADVLSMWHTVLYYFNVCIHIQAIHSLPGLKSHFFNAHMVAA